MRRRPVAQPSVRAEARHGRGSARPPGRLPVAARLPRIALFGLCVSLLGWTWWDARAGGYAGLAVNTLGQIIGDVLLMGLVAPIGLRRRRRMRTSDPALMGVIARAKHRVQLLDLAVCLHPALPRAVAAALANDACVEILLPVPDTPGVPDDYRDRLPVLLDALRALRRSGGDAAGPGRSGRLDVRLYRGPAAVSIVRCDGRIWASLHPDRPSGSAYLALDRDCANARALRAHFDRLHAEGLPPARAAPGPADAPLNAVSPNAVSSSAESSRTESSSTATSAVAPSTASSSPVPSGDARAR